MTQVPDALWRRMLAELPLIAILRGIQPPEAVEVAEALCSAGFLCIEVPLNSPSAMESISKIRDSVDGKLLVGAGTVLNIGEVAAACAAGAQIAVSPNTNPEVIRAVKSAGMISIPGFATPTEAFAAIAAQADALKLFPAEYAPPSVLKALKAVLPPTVPIFPVGGISADNMKAYLACGATGFGIGGSLYSPGVSADVVSQRAVALVGAWNECRMRPARTS